MPNPTPKTPDLDAIAARLKAATRYDIHAADFIVHAPADIAALLEYARRLEEEIAKLRPAPEKNPPDVPNTWLTVKGKNYQCRCGCELFHQHDRKLHIYHCNSCGEEVEGMPI